MLWLTLLTTAYKRHLTPMFFCNWQAATTKDLSLMRPTWVKVLADFLDKHIVRSLP